MTLAERYCKKCINYEMCQGTGCSDRKELEKLIEHDQKRKVIANFMLIDSVDEDMELIEKG